MLKFMKDNIDLVLKVLPLAFGMLSCIRIIIEYVYSKKMQDYFNIPYKYFVLDWKRSLVETLLYTTMLVVIVSTNYFCIVYRNEYTNVPMVFISFILINSIYVLATAFGSIFLNNLKAVKRSVVISFFVSLFFGLFLVLRVCKPVFRFFFLVYFLLSISFFVCGIIGYFRFQMNPERKYEIFTIDNQKYAIVGKNNNDYIVIKINDDYLFDPKNSFKIINDIFNCDISYHAIKKQ